MGRDREMRRDVDGGVIAQIFDDIRERGLPDEVEYDRDYLRLHWLDYRKDLIEAYQFIYSRTLLATVEAIGELRARDQMKRSAEESYETTDHGDSVYPK